MVIQLKIKILEWGKLSRTDEIKLVNMKTGANFFCLSRRVSSSQKYPAISWFLEAQNFLVRPLSTVLRVPQS